MLRVLYIDTLCPAGHKVFNSLTISALKNLKAELRLIGHERCFPEAMSVEYRIPETFLAKRKAGISGKFSYRIREYQKLRWLLQVLEKEHPDLAILSSFETISLSTISRSLKVPVLAFNHNNIDDLGSKVKKYFYRRIGNSVTQVVFENYMADYLKDNIKVRNRVIVLPHIVESNDPLQVQTEVPDANSILLFAPSSSNDFSVIEGLLERPHELREKGIKLVAKFREDVDQDAIILRKRFSDKEYDLFLHSCSAVYVPLPLSFNYRVSNVVNEAISSNKRIIISKNRFSEFLSSQYPSLVYVLNSNLLEELDELNIWINARSSSYNKEREGFLKDHCSERFLEELIAGLPEFFHE